MRRLERDGVALCYEEVGEGEPPILLVHGAVALSSAASVAITSFLEQLRGPNYREVVRPYVANSLFIPTDDQERKERVIYAATMYVFGAWLCQQEPPCKLEKGTVAYIYVYSCKGWSR
jgi:hypothetical protein